MPAALRYSDGQVAVLRKVFEVAGTPAHMGQSHTVVRDTLRGGEEEDEKEK